MSGEAPRERNPLYQCCWCFCSASESKCPTLSPPRPNMIELLRGHHAQVIAPARIRSFRIVRPSVEALVRAGGVIASILRHPTPRHPQSVRRVNGLSPHTRTHIPEKRPRGRRLGHRGSPSSARASSLRVTSFASSKNRPTPRRARCLRPRSSMAQPDNSANKLTAIKKKVRGAHLSIPAMCSL